MLLTVFFFNDTATTEIYTLSLHDALPICCVVFGVNRSIDEEEGAEFVLVGRRAFLRSEVAERRVDDAVPSASALDQDRKSTRLNSSHSQSSYAVFCLKKKKKITKQI